VGRRDAAGSRGRAGRGAFRGGLVRRGRVGRRGGDALTALSAAGSDDEEGSETGGETHPVLLAMKRWRFKDAARPHHPRRPASFVAGGGRQSGRGCGSGPTGTPSQVAVRGRPPAFALCSAGDGNTLGSARRSIPR